MKFLILSVFVLLLSGCVATSVTQLKSYRPKSENCSIEVFTQKPDRKFEEIALLSGMTGWGTQLMLSQLKKKACLAGGDAMIITHFGLEGVGDGAVPSTSATVIKFIKKQKD